MEKIIKKAFCGGYIPKYENTTILNSIINFCDDGSILATDENGKKLEIYDKEKIVLDPLFWQALFKNKTEALIPRQMFFSILFGDYEVANGEGWDKAISYLESIIN